MAGFGCGAQGHSEGIMAWKHGLHAVLVAAVALMAAPLHGSQFLIVTRDAGGAWSLMEADEIQVNGKAKIRTITVSTSQTDSWDSKTIGHLPEEPLANFTVIVRSADGKLYTQSAEGNGWTLLLPDGSNVKTAVPAAEIWRGAAISMKRDRKEKTGTPIAAAELYAIFPGQDAAASA